MPISNEYVAKKMWSQSNQNANKIISNSNKWNGNMFKIFNLLWKMLVTIYLYTLIHAMTNFYIDVSL